MEIVGNNIKILLFSHLYKRKPLYFLLHSLCYLISRINMPG